MMGDFGSVGAESSFESGLEDLNDLREKDKKRKLQAAERQRLYRAKKKEMVAQLKEEVDNRVNEEMNNRGNEEITVLRRHSNIVPKFFLKGYSFLSPIEENEMNNFKRVLTTQCLLTEKTGRTRSSTPITSTTITGQYEMQLVDPEKLDEYPETRNIMEPILTLGKEIFSTYLERPVEVYIHSSAILKSPVPNRLDLQQAQVMHADHLGFTAITVLIMLTEDGGQSTHIISAQEYGPDTNKVRDLLLDFKMPKNLDTIHPDIRDAIKERYHRLLELGPDEFFNVKASRKRLAYGEGEIFRADSLHAGPFCETGNRSMVFIEVRVRGEPLPKKDTQYRFPDLMGIAGYDQAMIADYRKVWEDARYFFPS